MPVRRFTYSPIPYTRRVGGGGGGNVEYTEWDVLHVGQIPQQTAQTAYGHMTY